MLDSLLSVHDQIADRLPPVAYKERSIEWILKLDASGTNYSFIETSDRAKLPDRGRTSGNSRPRLLDSAEWALGVPEEGKEDRAEKRHSNYLNLLQRAASEVDHEALTGYNWFLQSTGVAKIPEEQETYLVVNIGGESKEIQTGVLPESCQVGDCLLIQVDDSEGVQIQKLPENMDRSDRIAVRVDGKTVHELPEVQSWWARFIDEVKSEKITEHGPCAMCGEERPIARIHEEIRRFGNALSSYNKPAFRSYGKSKSYGAWMCQRCARRINRTLSWLLDSDDHSYYFNNSSWVYWTDTVQTAFSLNPVRDGDPNKIRRLLAGYYDGTLLENKTPLWMLAIEENQGRLIVRHLERSTVGRVQVKLAQYFEGMKVRGNFFGATALLMSLIQTANQSKTPEDIPSWMEAGLMRTALTGQSLPYAFLLAGLDRNQALGSVSGPRAALLKLYLITSGHDMSSALNPNHESQAYHLGRLFATLEYVQYKALGQTNTTITDRFFKSASTTPRGVFGNLIGNAQAHLSKIRKQEGDKAYDGAQKQIGSIMDRISEFPATLSPEKQALFSLGYYHQREERFDRSGDANEDQSDGE